MNYPSTLLCSLLHICGTECLKCPKLSITLPLGKFCYFPRNINTTTASNIFKIITESQQYYHGWDDLQTVLHTIHNRFLIVYITLWITNEYNNVNLFHKTEKQEMNLRDGGVAPTHTG